MAVVGEVAFRERGKRKSEKGKSDELAEIIKNEICESFRRTIVARAT
jgi:hypothetical protein